MENFWISKTLIVSPAELGVYLLEQLRISKTDFLDSDVIIIKSQLMGININFHVGNSYTEVHFTEGIIGMLEGFYSTSISDLTDIIPVIQDIKIYVTSEGEEFKIDYTYGEADLRLLLPLELKSNTVQGLENYYNFIHEVFAVLSSKLFHFRDFDKVLNGLYKNEEAHLRSFTFWNALRLNGNIFGDDSWLSFNQIGQISNYQEFAMLRTEPVDFKFENDPNTNKKNTNEAETNKMDEGLYGRRHDSTSVFSLFDQHLWSEAKWAAVGFLLNPEMSSPITLALAFENEAPARKIIEKWYNQFGADDKEEEISITIVSKFDSNNPHSYRVVIETNPNIIKRKLSEKHNDHLATQIARVHEMTPSSSHNIELLKSSFQKHGFYFLSVICVRNDIELKYLSEIPQIKKKEIHFKEAWEIDENSSLMSALQPDDNPIIPKGVKQPPVLKALKKVREMKNK